MTADETLRELRRLGTAQNRKIYARHGVAGRQFGVSFAHLEKLRKRIRTDHVLALKLWAAGNHDARVLATMIADPARAGARLLHAWGRSLDNPVLAGLFARFAAGTPLAREMAETWTAADDECLECAGWHLLSCLAGEEAAEFGFTEAAWRKWLGVIERDIHRSKNRVRHAMNNALIAIGVRSPALQNRALAAAKRIGRVEVDHGETGCKTPDAADYIRKTARWRRGRGRRQAARKV
jgi:3-methyladenine DNA glycosylase AlkD